MQLPRPVGYAYALASYFIPFILLVWLVWLLWLIQLPAASAHYSAAAQPFATITQVTSAASPQVTSLAPGARGTILGTGLATTTEAGDSNNPPVELGGRRVLINGQPAGLLLVSASRIDFVVPVQTPVGASIAVQVLAGATAIAATTVRITTVAPAIFTLDGGAVPSGFLVRVKADGAQIYEPLAQLDAVTGSYRLRPIDLGPPGDRVFIAFFLSGIRRAADPNADGNLNETVRVLVGADEFQPVFVGAASPSGLDQINLELSRSLLGRGQVMIAVAAPGAEVSNLAEINIGGGPSMLTVTGLNPELVQAGQTLEINGSNLPTNSANTEVLFTPDPGTAVDSAQSEKLTLRVPFGVATGPVRISVGDQVAWTSPADLRVQTSISGYVQDPQRRGISGLTVSVIGTSINTITNQDGAFVLTGMRAGLNLVRVDPMSTSLPVPRFPAKVFVTDGRDNQIKYYELQSIGSPGSFQNVDDKHIYNASLAMRTNEATTPSIDNIQLEVPANAVIQCPPESPNCQLALATFAPGHAPIDLPAGVFSSAIAQITPFGARITPGARLRFPNADSVPVGTPIRVYKYDLNPESPTVGQFIDIGPANFADAGQTLETAAGAVTEASFYFVSRIWPTATVYGHIIEADGRPARRAVVNARAQSTFTDGNGGFVLRNVPVIRANDRITIEVSFHRPDGTVSRTQRSDIAITADGQIAVTDIALPPRTANLGPQIIAPATIALNEGETREFNFIVTGMAAGTSPTLNGPSFASLRALGNDSFALRLAPAAGSAGNYQVALTAGNAQGNSTMAIAVTVNQASGTLPTALSQAVTTNEDQPVQITLASGNAGGSPVYTIVTAPLHGTLTGTPPALTYRPAANYNGPDLFTFRVRNGNAESAPAQVAIAVRPVNDPPVIIAPGPQSVGAGQTVRLTVTANDPDTGQTLTLTVPDAPPGAPQNPPQLTPTSWQFTWTPTFLQARNYELTFNVSDNGEPPATATVKVQINAGAKWARTSGPEGGSISALLQIGRTIFAGTTGGGIYRSTDNGSTWTTSNEGLSSTALVINTILANGNTIYLGTFEGVYRSTDNGQTWARKSSGIPDELPVFALLASGNFLFAGTGNLTGDGRGIYRSSNNGDSWTAINSGINPNTLNVTALARNGNSIFAGMGFVVFDGNPPFGGAGLYRSDNNGDSWTPVVNGLNVIIPQFNYIGTAPITTLLVNGSDIFAGTIAGVYRSTNNGASWSRTNPNLLEPPYLITSLAVIGNTLFAGTFGGQFVGLSDGFFRSTNNGASWTQANNGLTGYARNILRILATSDGTLFAGTGDEYGRGGGLYRSTNNGDNWQLSRSGIIAPQINTVLQTSSGLYATSSDSGISRSTDNGQSWISVNNGLLRSALVSYSVLELNNTLFLATEDGVYRSADGGANWTRVVNGLEIDAPYVYSLGAVGNTIYVGTLEGYVLRTTNNGNNWTDVSDGLESVLIIRAFFTVGTTLFAATDDGVYRLLNNGNVWQRFQSGFSGDSLNVVSLTAANNQVFAGTFGQGVFRSTDGGLNWTPARAGLTGDALNIVSLFAFSNQLFAGTGGINAFGSGVYRSLDNGTSWQPFNSALPNYISSITSDGQHIFAGASGAGVYIMSDNVQSWTETNAGLTNRSINSITTRGTQLFAGTLGGGVFRSTDQGANWAAASNGLPAAANIQTLTTSGANLFAGTFGQGVYRSTNDGSSWSALNNGLPENTADPLRNPRNVNAVRASGAQLLAATDGGVFRIADFVSGNTWAATNLTRRTASLFVIANTIYAGTLDDGVYRSTDGGASWQALGKQGLGNLTILSLAVSANGGTIFAGTDGGIYRTANQGASWTSANRDLPTNLVVTTLATNGDRLYAGSIYGVFLSRDNGERWTQINAGLLDIFVTSSTLLGDRLFVGAKVGGVFTSQLSEATTCLAINQQPQSQTISSGGRATLSVTPSGNQPFQFQWYEGTSGDFSRPISGATTNSYQTPVLTQTKNYWVLVTNGCGSASSETVAVIINATPQTDLALQQTVSVPQAAPGENITFTITLRNQGTSDAFSVMVTELLPTGVSFVSCQTTGGGICGGSGNVRTATIPTIAAGAMQTMTISARIESNAPANTQLKSTAAVTSAIIDANPTNDAASATVLVIGGQSNPTIDVQPLTIDFGNLELGAAADRPMTVRNTGNATLNVTSIKADGLLFVAVTPSSFSLAPNTQQVVALRCSAFSTGLQSSRLIIASNDPAHPNTIVQMSGTGIVSSSPLTLSFLGKARDRVGQSKTSITPDGQLDGTFGLRFPTGFGQRTITKMALSRTGGGAWDTDPASASWVIGVADTIDSNLRNSANGSVNIPISGGSNLALFIADNSGLFTNAASFTLVITFSDASSVTTYTTLTVVALTPPAITTNPPTRPAPLASSALGEPTPTLVFNGRLRDQVGRAKSGLTPDGDRDGTFTLAFPEEIHERTIIYFKLECAGGQVWDTDPDSSFWRLGAADSLDTPLHNREDGSINIPVSGGSHLILFGADDGGLFARDELFILTIGYADGTGQNVMVMIAGK
jgi:uncharacterized protein (TIGR03437 family)